MKMNGHFCRTRTLLAALLLAGPASALAADRLPPVTSSSSLSTTAEKAAEAERLAKLAGELAQRAAALAAESQTKSATAAFDGESTSPSGSPSGWFSRRSSEVQISDAIDPAPAISGSLSGWRSPRKANEVAIRFMGDEAPAAEALKLAEVESKDQEASSKPTSDGEESPQADADSTSVAENSTIKASEETNADAGAGSTNREALKDDNLQLAVGMYRDNEVKPADGEEPMPAPGMVHRNGKLAAPYSEYSGSCDACGVECCSPPPLFWNAGVEATFLWPDLNSFGTTFLFEEATGVPPRQDWFSSSSEDVSSMYLAPRIWLGVQGCKWGANVRYWHLHASEGSFDPSLGPESLWDDYGAGIPDIGVFTCSRLEAYTLDLELTRRFCVHDCQMQVSAGIRHAEIEHAEGITGNALGDDAILMGYGQASRYSRGTGVIFGIYGRRPIFPCSCVHWFYNVHWSTMWGPTATAVETATMITATDVDGVATAGSVNGASTYVDDTLYVGEFQLGLEWDYALACLPANAFFRAAVEYQRWDGGRGFSSSTSFAAVEVMATETAYGEFNAAAAEPELDLLGISLSTGLTW